MKSAWFKCLLGALGVVFLLDLLYSEGVQMATIFWGGITGILPFVWGGVTGTIPSLLGVFETIFKYIDLWVLKGRLFYYPALTCLLFFGCRFSSLSKDRQKELKEKDVKNLSFVEDKAYRYFKVSQKEYRNTKFFLFTLGLLIFSGVIELTHPSFYKSTEHVFAWISMFIFLVWCLKKVSIFLYERNRVNTNMKLISKFSGKQLQVHSTRSDWNGCEENGLCFTFYHEKPFYNHEKSVTTKSKDYSFDSLVNKNTFKLISGNPKEDYVQIERYFGVNNIRTGYVKTDILRHSSLF